MNKKLKYLIAAILSIVLIVVIIRFSGNGSSTEARRAPAALVKIEQPGRETVLYQLEFQGDVLPIQQANIFSKVGGNLDRVYVNMGSEVLENQLLALIDTTELFQTYQQTAATYQNARTIYERSKELVEKNLAAKQDLDNSAALMKVAQANFETAEIRLRYARITAPFGGVITRRFLDPGALVNLNSSTLFTLMDLDAVKLIINVLDKDIPSIATGMKAVIAVDAFPGKEFNGKVARFSQAVDLSSRTMAVEIDIPNPNHLLKPGMFASVHLIVKEHANAVTVPAQAVQKDDKGAYVFIADGNTARRVNVTVGIDQKGRTEILSGLTGTEQLITTGQQMVKQGDPVKIQ